ncbi:NAD-dependent protein deacetylase [Comamonas terrigena]|uniref:NAD-dependent protein deacetylase n=1 Tax=Comamonas terrigena TaxID=32013 RepID=A0A2A7UWI7_COMTR|nr:NAD-dependent protein deacetylase [Comamonas terrigena]PEH89566.1 NAD-dependent deacetylase [Comamonas terrigena]BBL24756.1 NAD-dependent protein deacetylase [Comamonas terrigena NBRC 13299]SUY71653.1 NAD-dependent deacetylase [Comamonas terrigena]
MHYALRDQPVDVPAATPAQLLDWARQHPRWLVITGAGCSTEVGIPDYRDQAGQWKRPQPVTYQAFMGDALVRQRYWARSLVGWRVMGHARPGAAHHALAALEKAGRVQLLLTQNVDGLHSAAGSRKVLDLHGRIDTVRCMDCGHRFARADWQRALEALNPDWVQLQARTAPDGDADLDGLPFAEFRIPPCPHCGTGVLKPDVVFFGESVPRERVQRGLDTLAQVDGVLVAGSSLMVYSGFRFVQAAAAAGLPVLAINQGRTRADALLAAKLQADVGQSLQALVQGLGAGGG